MNQSLPRRRFAFGAAAATAFWNRPHSVRASTGAGPRTICFVGGYNKHAPPGGAGNGDGIVTFQMDPGTGALTRIATYADIASPSFITLSGDRRFLYALSEINDFDAAGSGSVSAFSIDSRSGALRKLNTVSSGGAVPAHLSVHQSGRFVLVANYGGGSVAVLPIRPDGSLEPASDVARNSGPRMPDRAADGPPGNFAVSDHSRPHVHMVQSDPSGRCVLAADAGLDRIYVWRIDLDAGRLSPAPVPFAAMMPGSAPRHFQFSRDGTILYVICEQDSKVVVADFDARTGRIALRQSASTVTGHFRGTTLASGLLLAPDGRFLYAGNRLGDSMAVFSIGPSGTLSLSREIWMHADYGRSMMFDPSGTFLYSANQRSDSLTCFKVDHASGDLDFTWQFTPVGSPTTLAFMRLG
jgi:6-phosphogluconolactonase (cycloisomerase 2 family)